MVTCSLTVMEIFGRTVEAINYGDTTLVTVYVRLKPGDCRREQEPSYTCIDNCGGSLVIARFLEKHPISIKALAPEELSVSHQIPGLANISGLEGLERMADKKGYSLRSHGKGKVLYLHGEPVAVYNPCGFSMKEQLWSPEVQQTTSELVLRVNEVYAIAENKPIEDIVEDKALANQLRNPLLRQLIQQMVGDEGTRLVDMLSEMQAQRN